MIIKAAWVLIGWLTTRTFTLSILPSFILFFLRQIGKIPLSGLEERHVLKGTDTWHTCHLRKLTLKVAVDG